MSSRLGLSALFLMLLAGGVFLLFQQFPGVLRTQGEQIRLVQGLIVLGLVGSSFVLGWNESAGVAVKQALVWAGVLILVLTAYAYRYEFISMGFRIAGVTLPSVALPEPPGGPDRSRQGVVYLNAVQGGHFLADAAVNGTHVRFMVDTGASVIALSAYDAQRLRMDLKKLNFNIPLDTANGKNFAALVTLDEVRIGSISRRNMQAVVVRDGLEQSLLGMSFLNSLGSFEISDGVLILRD